MFQKKFGPIAIAWIVALMCLVLAAFAYSIPSVQEQLLYRISQLRAQIKYALSPPEEVVFTPNSTVASIVQATMALYTHTATITPDPTPTPGPTSTPTLIPTDTPIPTPLPDKVQLSGITHEYQKWNNCGPANLSMALSYWGWDGDQRPVAAFVKPNPRDKNVMPYELAAFVEEETGLKAIVRVGGDLDLIKSLIAAGFPVIVEKGFEGPGFDGWMGHYEVITGYDDDRERLTAQDSYIMANFPLPYEDLEQYWPHFNYTYLVIYPLDREIELMNLLGPHSDETENYEFAAQKASNDIFNTSGRDQFFAWFNRGTNLMRLQDYGGAAAAYDEAFLIDAEIARTDPDHRAWRMMWYQTGPYWAYFYTGRYYDVINLATTTINLTSEPTLEESFYWRALAKDAIGDRSGAIEDLQKALNWHPYWEPALVQLQSWGVAL